MVLVRLTLLSSEENLFFITTSRRNQCHIPIGNLQFIQSVPLVSEHVIIIELKPSLQVIQNMLTLGRQASGVYTVMPILQYFSSHLIIALVCWPTSGYSQARPARNTILNLNENQGGVFDDLFKLTMNLPINILILMESHQENEILFVCDCMAVEGWERGGGMGGKCCSQLYQWAMCDRKNSTKTSGKPQPEQRLRMQFNI